MKKLSLIFISISFLAASSLFANCGMKKENCQYSSDKKDCKMKNYSKNENCDYKKKHNYEMNKNKEHCDLKNKEHCNIKKNNG